MQRISHGSGWRALMTTARTFALACGLAGAALVALAWAGCGNNERTGTHASGAGGATGIGGSAAEGSVGQSGSPGDANAAAEPCPYWPGWHRVPQLPEGCVGMCVPDELSKVPKPVWEDRPDWCAGCETLDAPPSGVPAWARMDGGIWAAGAPDFYAFTEHFGNAKVETDALGLIVKSDNSVVAALKTHDLDVCGRFRLDFSSTGKLGLQLWGTVGSDNYFYDVDPANAGKLFASPPPEPTLTWKGSLVGQSVPQFISFSDQLLAVDFFREAIGIPSTDEQFYADTLPGGPPGQCTAAHVAGDAAFLDSYDLKRTEWYVYQDHQIRHFLGTPDHDISVLATDGKLIVWKEGSNPVPQPDGSVAWFNFKLYSSPFTTDPTALQPRLLMTDVPRDFSWLRIANGFLSGIYSVQTKPARETAALVVRLSDGRAWVSDLPDSYNWSARTFPGKTQLWGGVTPSPSIMYAETLARVPYSAMKLLQNAAPGPDAGSMDGGAADASTDSGAE